MTLLAIDTSGAYASVALYDGRAVLAEETWYAQRRHDDQLFAAVERVLLLAGAEIGAVTRIAVARGPGSFTGLRVGIAAAQGLARAAGALVVGVCTLDAIAHPFAIGRTRVCAIVPAGRGEVYAALYRRREGRWSRVTPIQTAAPRDLARAVATATVFAGDIDEAMASELREAFGGRALVAPPSARARRAGDLAEVAWARAEAGEAIAPEALEPLYIRPPLSRDPKGASERPAPPARAS